MARLWSVFLLFAGCHDLESWSAEVRADVAETEASNVETAASDEVTDDRVDVPDRPRTIGQLLSMAAGGLTYVDERVEHALVTSIRPATGNDPAGFFIQESRTGPALLVLWPDAESLVPGDAVSFEVRTLGVRFGVPRVVTIEGVTSEPTTVDLRLLDAGGLVARPLEGAVGG